MKDWVENELYVELTQMPLWTASAFGSLRDGDVIAPDSTLYTLMTYLIRKKIDQCPKELVDPIWQRQWKTSEFKTVFKSAVNRCKELTAKKIESPGSVGW